MKLSLPSLVFIASFSVAISLIIMANMWSYAILGEVNGRRSKEDQIGMFWISLKMGQILRLHAQLYPDSPKRKQMWAFAFTGFAFLFGGALAFVVLNSR